MYNVSINSPPLIDQQQRRHLNFYCNQSRTFHAFIEAQFPCTIQTYTTVISQHGRVSVYWTGISSKFHQSEIKPAFDRTTQQLLSLVKGQVKGEPTSGCYFNNIHIQIFKHLWSYPLAHCIYKKGGGGQTERTGGYIDRFIHSRVCRNVYYM